MAKTIDERRQHQRTAVSCPIALARGDSQIHFMGRTTNVSDGGAMLQLDGTARPRLRETVQLKISVPRRTLSTFMLEEFAAEARIVRCESAPEDTLDELAVEFLQPLRLGLDA